MPSFEAEVVFHFESQSIEAAGRELRQLHEAADEMGFQLTTARVKPRPPDAPPAARGTSYAPLEPRDS